ncbi:MAG: DUF4157 domain-containing protein [Bryobacterales bacterium]
MPDPKSTGRPLNAALQHKLQAGLGLDLSAVRIHQSQQSVQAGAAINARAFTQGNDIFFQPGAYAPHTDEGKRLLAHELSHVVQQRKGGRADEEKAKRLADEILGKL